MGFTTGWGLSNKIIISRRGLELIGNEEHMQRPTEEESMFNKMPKRKIASVMKSVI